jgi:hypothetical protein
MPAPTGAASMVSNGANMRSSTAWAATHPSPAVPFHNIACSSLPWAAACIRVSLSFVIAPLNCHLKST